MQELTCQSWLNGKHTELIEINTSLPFVSIDEFYWQGDEADRIIQEINEIYNDKKLNFTPKEAIKYWASIYL